MTSSDQPNSDSANPASASAAPNSAQASTGDVGIVGGTGPAGAALAARLADVGYSVVLGSRSRYRSMEVVDKLMTKWPDRNLDITPAENAVAACADTVVIATPWDAAAITARSVADYLHGKVVTTMSNALARVDGEFVPLIPPRGSVAASVQAIVPDARVAATLQHVPANELGDLNEPLHGDILICSDSREATAAVAKMVGRIPGARALDCGNLSNATAIEVFTAVLLQLNSRYRTRVALRLVGLDHLDEFGEPSEPGEPKA